MFVIIVGVLLILLYYYGTRNYNYWSDRRVPHKKPLPFFGTNIRNFLQYENRIDAMHNLYRDFPDQRVVGFYRGSKPKLLLRDPDIIRAVLTTEFSNFYVRGLGRDPDVEPMLLNLFHTDGDRWKLLRQRLTPAFSSGKLKAMFPLIVECAENMQALAGRISESGQPYDMRELMARFTTDFIGACGFGIKMNSINDDSSRFRELGKNILNLGITDMIKVFLKDQFPKLCKPLKPMKQSVEDSIVKIVTEIMEQRNNTPVGRNDFIDLLMELRHQGKLVTESIEECDADGKPKPVEMEMDVKLMAAQCFIFFVAGFETSSSASSYTLHELAHNPAIQEKVHEEIDRILAKYDGTLCYDAVKEMTYLECTVKEALRMYPSLAILNRVCTRRCKVPGTDVWIDKGVLIAVSVKSLHNDPKYFENPEEFNPSRFLLEETKDRHRFVYLPFGEGPRACIGTRMGMMQTMAGLAALLRRHRVQPVPGAPRYPRFNPRSNVIPLLLGGLPLILTGRSP